jgi:anti-sigma factor RsiW
MNATVYCSQTLLLQAEFDGELDAAQSTALEVHKTSCSLCSEAWSQLEQSRSFLRSAQRFTVPESMHDALKEQFKAASQIVGPTMAGPETRSNKIRYLGSGAGIGALAAGVLAFVLLSVPGQRAADLIVDNHVRAMQSPTHLLDVVSSEHHTVKPWFAGQIDFAPPVKDMEGFGYPLRGGRIDVIAGRKIAVLVYRAGLHSIDVSIEPSTESVSGPTELRGFNLRHWSDAQFDFWAVSDLNARELEAFVEHWKAAR